MRQDSREEIIRWLWTDEGMKWSSGRFPSPRYQTGLFAEIKEDHECRIVGLCSGFMLSDLGLSNYTGEIQRDIRKYGMNGLPREAVL